MKFRAMFITIVAFAMATAVACGGSEKKADDMPTEETAEQPLAEEASAESEASGEADGGEVEVEVEAEVEATVTNEDESDGEGEGEPQGDQ